MAFEHYIYKNNKLYEPTAIFCGHFGFFRQQSEPEHDTEIYNNYKEYEIIFKCTKLFFSSSY